MKVYVERDPKLMASRVYVEVSQPDQDGNRYFETTLSEGLTDHRIVRVAPGSEPPMFCEPIRDEIATALAEALSPRPVATERHLDDAIAVRDRMLALVEKVVQES